MSDNSECSITPPSNLSTPTTFFLQLFFYLPSLYKGFEAPQRGVIKKIRV